MSEDRRHKRATQAVDERRTPTPMAESTPGAPPAGAVKRCVCGQNWDAEAWRELPYVGVQEFEDAPRLELRQCDKCGSTLALKLQR
jgi:hypothetical protein